MARRADGFSWFHGCVLMMLALVGCASTQLIDEWRDESFSKGPIEKILIIATASNERGRRMFEDSFVRAFKASNIEAVASYSLLPGSVTIDKAMISKAIEGKGFDAVMITSHERTDKKSVYVPGEVRMEAAGYPYPYRSRNWGYYDRRAYRTIEQPGYYDEQQLVYLETSLYEATNGKLIWSARSESANPQSVQNIVDSLSKLVIKSLERGGFF